MAPKAIGPHPPLPSVRSDASSIMKRIFTLCLAWLVCGSLWAEPVKIVFDTDMANDCDDAGALAVLNALADLGEAEILAVVTNRKDPSNASAAACSAINTWYGRGDVPIGTDKDGAKTKNSNPSSYAPVLRDEFPHSAKPDDEMPDALRVYREALAAQPDGSVVICSVGALSNLEDLLRSAGDDLSPMTGGELIEAKVKHTVIMGGWFPRSSKPETNIKLDPASAVTVVNEWPGLIHWQGYEVGAAVINGAELKEVPPTNPVRRSYELRPFPPGMAIDRGKPAHDLTAVLFAVRGEDPELWHVVKNGRVIADSDGHTEWKRDWAKRHRYLQIAKGTGLDGLTQVVGDLLTAPPKNR